MGAPCLGSRVVLGRPLDTGLLRDVYVRRPKISKDPHAYHELLDNIRIATKAGMKA